MKTIYLAGGCFWGVEEYFSRMSGVTGTTVGYANGNIENPDYKEVKKGTTGHAETVEILYDETLISLNQLLDAFYLVIDPTLLNRQGEDEGTQYRTGIYYLEDEDLTTIQQRQAAEQARYSEPIVTEICPLNCFYSGEEYHQKYLKKNPGGYCHIKLD